MTRGDPGGAATLGSSPPQYALQNETVDQDVSWTSTPGSLLQGFNSSGEFLLLEWRDGSESVSDLEAEVALNASLLDNATCFNVTDGGCGAAAGNYWALLLVLFPILTVFGNILVILAVYRERALQSATNYFIVSLAFADLLVAVVVMPFAVYVLVSPENTEESVKNLLNEVNGTWSLPAFVCDFYIAMDVTCSTSSIFNLVAISIDRYIAVTQPIKYAKHKNNTRVWCTIVAVWVISACIGSPIVLGLNNTPNRDPDLCLFFNSDFILYSSLSSFYIPCFIMVFLYYNIFKALSSRARKARAARKPQMSELKSGTVIENLAQTRRLAETALGAASSVAPATSSGLEEERPTNTGSGSQEEDDDNDKDNDRSFDMDDGHVIPNDRSTEFILASVVEEAARCRGRSGSILGALAPISLPLPLPGLPDPNGNADSGYVASHSDEPGAPTPPLQTAPKDGSESAAAAAAASAATAAVAATAASGKQAKRNGAAALKRVLSGSILSSSDKNSKRSDSTKGNGSSSKYLKDKEKDKGALTAGTPTAAGPSTGSGNGSGSGGATNIGAEGISSVVGDNGKDGSRFTICRTQKASRKKRDKSSARKERKATKTLAIVLGVFLFCWVPFFTCNILDALCTKLGYDCQPGMTAFILTTWLGYMNSFVNPVIYTIFNPEFRKAFKKLIALDS